MTRKKMGRPPKPVTASKVIPPARVTPEQLKNYKDAANFKNEKLSAWIKSSLDKAAKRDLKKLPKEEDS